MEGNHTLPLFDHDIGDLIGIDLTVDLRVLQSIRLENEDPEGHNVSVDSESEISLAMPDSSSLSINAPSPVSEELEGYDGDMDYGGPSGKTIEGVVSEGSAAEEYMGMSDFTASSQNGTISLPAAMSIRSSISGSVTIRRSASVESRLCVTYTYEPKALEEVEY